MNKKETVGYVLKKYPETRSDDILLYCMCGLESGVLAASDRDYLKNVMKAVGTPESYTRARRDIQAENPHLRPDKKTQEKRNKRAKLMRETRGDVDKVDAEMF